MKWDMMKTVHTYIKGKYNIQVHSVLLLLDLFASHCECSYLPITLGGYWQLFTSKSINNWRQSALI